MLNLSYFPFRALAFHTELPVILTGSEDDTVRLWHSTTYRLESTLNYGLGRVWTVECRASGSGGCQQSVVGIGYDEGMVVVALGGEHPAVCMDGSGARHSEMVNANLRSVIASITAGTEGTDTEANIFAAPIAPQSPKPDPHSTLDDFDTEQEQERL